MNTFHLLLLVHTLGQSNTKIMHNGELALIALGEACVKDEGSLRNKQREL